MDPSELGLADDASIVSEARAIATHYFHTEAVSHRACFSRTIEVRLADDRHVIVQLKAESVTESNAQQAHQLLGNLVPVPTLVEYNSPVPYIYVMPLITGTTWLDNDTSTWPANNHIKLAGQTGDTV